MTVTQNAINNVPISITANGNTTQNTTASFDLRSVSISGAGAASVGFSASNIVISVPTQTVQTEGWTAVGNTTGATSSTTFNSNFSISGSGGASVGFSGQTIQIAAPATSAMSWVAAGQTTGSTSSTTFQNAFTISGAGGDSVGFSGNTIIISGGAGGAGGMGSWSAVGQTTGSTSSTSFSNSLSLSGAGAVSVGFSGNTVIISGATAGATQSWSAIGNTTASTSSTSFGTGLSISGAGGASVGFSGQSVVISAPTGVTASDSYFPYAIGAGGQFAVALASNALWMNFINVNDNLSISRAEIAISMVPQTSLAASTGSWSGTLAMGLYVNNAGTLSTLMATSSIAYSTSWSSNSSISIAGGKVISVPFATMLTPGQYWVAFNLSTATGANLSATQSIIMAGQAGGVGLNQFTANAQIGAVGQSVWPPANGSTTTAANTLPASFAFSTIRGTAPGPFILHLGTTALF